MKLALIDSDGNVTIVTDNIEKFYRGVGPDEPEPEVFRDDVVVEVAFCLAQAHGIPYTNSESVMRALEKRLP